MSNSSCIKLSLVGVFYEAQTNLIHEEFDNYPTHPRELPARADWGWLSSGMGYS